MRKNRIVTRDRSKITVIGRLKIGEKVKNANGVEYPKSTDYFIPKGEFAQSFTEIYGEKPSKLLIFFPNADALTQQYVLYCDGALHGSSDGETVEYFENKERKEITFPDSESANIFMLKYAEKVNKSKKQKSIAEWKLTVNIQFVLAEIRNVMGLWSFETAGKASMVDQIANSFDNAIEMFGNIVGVPFWLTVEKVSHKSAVKGAQVFPVVSLSPAIGFGQYMQLKTGSSDPLQLIDNTIKMLLPKENKAIEPGLKLVTQEKINDAILAIESGKISIEKAIEAFKSNGYEDVSKELRTPRHEYLQTIINSVSEVADLEIVLSDLEGTGFEIDGIDKVLLDMFNEKK